MAYESIQVELGRLKREQPFKAFDIVTRDGSAVHVGGRFLFGHNGNYVLVGDQNDRVTRIQFDNIVKIAESDSSTGAHA